MNAKTRMQKQRAAYMAADALMGDTSPDVIIDSGERVAELAFTNIGIDDVAQCALYVYALTSVCRICLTLYRRQN